MGDTGSFSDKDNCPLSVVIGEGPTITEIGIWESETETKSTMPNNIYHTQLF